MEHTNDHGEWHIPDSDIEFFDEFDLQVLVNINAGQDKPPIQSNDPFLDHLEKMDLLADTSFVDLCDLDDSSFASLDSEQFLETVMAQESLESPLHAVTGATAPATLDVPRSPRTSCVSPTTDHWPIAAPPIVTPPHTPASHPVPCSTAMLHLPFPPVATRRKDGAVATPKKRKRKRQSKGPKNYIEGEPKRNDVRLGQGGATNRHPGNIRYLQEKQRLRPRYLAATRSAKTVIAQQLVDWIRESGGRFVALDKQVHQWYEVDNLRARDKASQALREEHTPEAYKAKRARHADG